MRLLVLGPKAFNSEPNTLSQEQDPKSPSPERLGASVLESCRNPQIGAWGWVAYRYRSYDAPRSRVVGCRV